MKKDTKIKVIEVLASNYQRIYAYLKPKDYKNLSICNREIFLFLNSQQNYKTIFEQKWGRTGFGLE